VFAILYCLLSCSSEKASNTESRKTQISRNSFQQDIDFLKQYTALLVLQDPDGQGVIAVAPALQGRVMTSSATGQQGRSHGWINRPLFESGDTLEQINAFGGEERFWLGPEGGQYSLFFEKGAPFALENWRTPRLIDLDAFEVAEKTTQKAVFTRQAKLTNYADFTFEFDIERIVEVLSPEETFRSLGLDTTKGIRVVGYQTTNTLTNTGTQAWRKETGLLSIWLLGMFNPSDETTVVLPYQPKKEGDTGPIVNDVYFGKVPESRLKPGKGVVYFKGDGKYRSKIGLSPERARDLLGAYDSDSKILTIVTYNKPEGLPDYVNALWEFQEEPYRGDVVNTYNDGPPEPGKDPLGPFYELETSSPALALKSGESGTHIQQTYHFEGEESALNEIAVQLLGVSLEEIENAFSNGQ
jgi:hypothetical protein